MAVYDGYVLVTPELLFDQLESWAGALRTVRETARPGCLRNRRTFEPRRHGTRGGALTGTTRVRTAASGRAVRRTPKPAQPEIDA
ncbi:hypothetical protein [Nonomuraea sp. NPDC005650]|uniref:hypothetical protein n=1 Tax=Nonomuraea sp. NPDC005650 TaxID=3157045 RepID=UPI0033AAB72F